MLNFGEDKKMDWRQWLGEFNISFLIFLAILVLFRLNWHLEDIIKAIKDISINIKK